MIKLIITSILAITLLSSYSQQKYTSQSNKAIKLYQTAIELLNERNNEKAIVKLQAAIEEDLKFIEAYLTLADIYDELGDIDNEIKYYRKGLRIDSSFFNRGFLNLGMAEFNKGYYNEAKKSFLTFMNFEDVREYDKIVAHEYIESCDFAIDAINSPVPFDPINLGDSINTKYNEYSPTITADGKTLIFTSLIPGNPSLPDDEQQLQEDFFISEYVDNEWMGAKAISHINTRGNEGAQSISSDGMLMFFTACTRGGMGSCDIYFSLKKNGQWSNPRNLGRPVNSGAWESQPSISPDGKTLYFVSNRLGGKGKMDIWMSRLTDDGFWGNPVNLGDSINTIEEETSPFIHADNKTLYFSSNGRIGMGGHDLFFSRFKSDSTWTNPKNLGYPINTHNDEKGLIVNAKGDKAYFSSDRKNEMDEDLYEFELYKEARPTPVSYVKGRVYDAYSKIGLLARFELIDVSSTNTIMESVSHKPEGEFLVCLPVNNNYALNVSKPGYLFYSENFSLDTVSDYISPYEIDIPLYPILVGEKIILRNIFYEYNSYALLEESKAELDKLVEFMNNNPRLIAEISGHTDNIGNDDDNLLLSEKRAGAVANYLVDNGINPNRIASKGFGDTRPLDSNDTPEGRANNRRTEFTVIGN